MTRLTSRVRKDYKCDSWEVIQRLSVLPSLPQLQSIANGNRRSTRSAAAQTRTNSRHALRRAERLIERYLAAEGTSESGERRETTSQNAKDYQQLQTRRVLHESMDDTNNELRALLEFAMPSSQAYTGQLAFPSPPMQARESNDDLSDNTNELRSSLDIAQPPMNLGELTSTSRVHSTDVESLPVVTFKKKTAATVVPEVSNESINDFNPPTGPASIFRSRKPVANGHKTQPDFSCHICGQPGHLKRPLIQPRMCYNCGGSPSDEWSDGAAVGGADGEPVPATLNVEDWFQFFGINGNNVNLANLDMGMGNTGHLATYSGGKTNGSNEWQQAEPLLKVDLKSAIPDSRIQDAPPSTRKTSRMLHQFIRLHVPETGVSLTAKVSALGDYSTISKDNTAGDNHRRSMLLSGLGAKHGARWMHFRKQDEPLSNFELLSRMKW